MPRGRKSRFRPSLKSLRLDRAVGKTRLEARATERRRERGGGRTSALWGGLAARSRHAIRTPHSTDSRSPRTTPPHATLTRRPCANKPPSIVRYAYLYMLQVGGCTLNSQTTSVSSGLGTRLVLYVIGRVGGQKKAATVARDRER